MKDGVQSMFLIGGGWDSESFSLTYGPFIDASTKNNRRKIMLILALEDDTDAEEMEAKYRVPFESFSLNHNEIETIFLSKDHPLSIDALISVSPTGFFVGGGLTPLYHELLCQNTEWLDYLVENQIPYGGFSAGSAITSQRAVVGGWMRQADEIDIPIIDEDVGEELNRLTVRDGLGLMPHSIDVHCGQWGTITRLINALDGDLIESGLGIDENTMIQVTGGSASVRGFGQVYTVTHDENAGITIAISRHGDNIDL